MRRLNSRIAHILFFAISWSAVLNVLTVGGYGQMAPSTEAFTEYQVTGSADLEGITTGPDGAIWFAENTSGNIGRIMSGVVNTYALHSSYSVTTITPGPDGALWFVGGILGRISTTGNITQYPSFGGYGITAGSDGALWFTGSYNNTIGRITTTGIVTQFPIPTPDSYPTNIVAGADGALWFIENGAQKIARITTAGIITEFPVRYPLYGLTRGPDGAIWFTYEYRAAIGRITADGGMTELPVSSGAGNIITGPDGALWFTSGSHTIGRMTVTGALTQYNIPTSFANPVFLTTGPDGAIWFTENGSGKIGRLQFAPTPVTNLSAWMLIWSDEFNGATGSPVDPSNWLYDTGTGYPCSGCPPNWGTGEIESMTSSTANVYQDGTGDLVIKPIHSGNDPTSGWTSGRIETTHADFQAPAGGSLAVEASIQQPAVSGASAAGYWPAFWVLGAAFRGNYLNWPSVGEVDILESVNGLSSVFGAFHCGSDPGGPCNEPTGISSGQQSCVGCQSGFHTYRVELDKSISPEELRYYLDGVEFFHVMSNQVDATTWANATNHAFFVVLDLAIGGAFPAAFGGGPTNATQSGVPMLVDYVRVYTRTPTSPASQTITFNPQTTSYPVSAGSFTLNASASSGLPVSFSSLTLNICTVSGATVTLLATGICTIQASQAGNANYSSAVPVSVNFMITSPQTNSSNPATAPLPIADVETGSILVGYIVVTGDVGSALPVATLTYGSVSGGIVQSQAAVLPVPLTAATSMAVDIVPGIGRNLGLAIANPGGSPAVIILTLSGLDGTTAGSPVTFSIPARAQVPRFLSELFPATTVGAAFRGGVSIQSSTPVSIIGLRFSGAEFSTLPVPVSNPAAVPANGSVGGTNASMFPQFAMSGGWATALDLLNNTSSTISGRVDIFDSNGNPLAILWNGNRQSTFTYSIPPNGALSLSPRDVNGQSPF